MIRPILKPPGAIFRPGAPVPYARPSGTVGRARPATATEASCPGSAPTVRSAAGVTSPGRNLRTSGADVPAGFFR
jgi:hypothetical protein